MNAHLRENNDNFGYADLSKWDTSGDPTVLVFRQTGKEITAKQVEVLVAYCKGVLSRALEGNVGYGPYSSRTERGLWRST